MDINPKHHAKTKRKKFQSRRDYRYGGKIGGHSTVKNYSAHEDRKYGFNCWGSTPDSGVSRQFKNMPGRKAELMKQAGMRLPFEQKLGIDMSGPAISLDKKKRWETIPEALEKMNPAAKSEYDEAGSNMEVYGIKDDWTIDELVSAIDYQAKIDDTFKPTWVKDRHYYSMQKRYKYRKRSLEDTWPKHLLKYDRLKPSSKTTGVLYGNASWRYCSEWNGDTKKRSYLQVEFSTPVRLVAIGSKGERTFIRPERESVGRAYVKQYRIQYKNGDDYIGLPKTFTANKDADTEVTNNIQDPTTGKLGLEITGIRIVPVNKRSGYHYLKSMRIALYGEYLEDGVVDPPGDGGLRQETFEGTIVTLEKKDCKKKKEFPRKTKSPQYSPEWRYSKPTNRRAREDALIVASGGYDIFKSVPELAI